MIYTKRSITIRNTTASIDAPVILYRGDKEVEIIFEIIDSKFKFESSNGNLIDNSHAAYGQMVVACPNGSNTISDVMKCENGLITFVMKTSMMDEMTEVGKYSFHIRLYNDDKTSRITLPPVMGGIEVRESLVIDDNTVNTAMVGYSTIQTYGAEEPAFDESGNYIKTDWQTGDIITASKLNKIEESLESINNDIPTKTSELVNDSGFLTSIPSEYVTDSELNEKGYLSSIPSEYVTDSELNSKGYLTEHQDISNKADKSEIPTKTSQLTNDSNYLTSIPSEYITETELNEKGYSTFNGDYNNLTNKPTIPSISGLASESYVNEYVENAIKDIPKEEVDLSDYAKKTELPTKLSQLANDEGYITSIPSEYITESELNSKGYLTQHQDISGKADKSEIPTKTSQLTNDSNFLTSVPSEYITETELNQKGYLTEHQNLSDYAKTVDIPTKTSDLTNDSNYLTSIPSEYITETELNQKGYSTFNGDYNNLTNKPTIPTETSQLNNDSGFLTSIPSEYVTESELNSKGYLTEHQDISGKADKSEIPTKTSQLTNDSNYLTSIPSEYITETELNQKGYLTEHQDISNKADKSEIPTKTSELTNDSGFLTAIPSEYVTDSELNAKGYLTEHQDLSNYALESEIPTKTSQLTNDSNFLTNIPSEYVTDSELNSKGYLTSHQDISGKADKSELHNHSNKSVLDGITYEKIQLWETSSSSVSVSPNEPIDNSVIWIDTDSEETISLSEINDNNISNDSTWSSNKIQQELSLVAPTINVVDSIEEMVDTNKQYVLSTDGFIYAYKEVSGDGEQVPNFTNLADVTSSDWLTDVRLSTSSTSSASGACVTNYIPCSAGDIIRVKGVNIAYYSSSTAHKSRFHVLNSNKALVTSDCGYVTELITSGHASSDGDITTVEAGWTTTTTVTSHSTTAYERFCGHLLDGYTLDDVIITVNEEITYTTSSSGSEYKWVSTGISYASSDYSEDITRIKEDINNLEETISSLDNSNPIPSYWKTELETKADTIQQVMESVGRNKSAFYWYTDAHWQSNAKNSPILLDYLIKNTPINKVNFGGDIIGDPSPYDHTNIKSFYSWQKAIANIPNHHSVYGNHDLNHWTTDVHKIAYALVLAHEESNDMIVSDIDSCYYIDCPSERTRYLYLSYLTKSQTDMMTQGQFIVDSIKDVKEEWHIVVIAHRWFQYSSSSNPTVGSTPAYEAEILDIFDKYNTRTTRSGSNYFYEQDFTDCKGKVEFCIGGHIHVDYDFTSPGGIPVIVTASDTNQERANGEDEDCGITGTITEQAVYAIVADYEGGKINVIGIGRGGSREVSLN